MKVPKVLLMICGVLILTCAVSYAAVSSTTTHANNTPGDSVVIKGSIYDMKSTPLFTVGTKVAFSDGRVYRYAHLGADTDTGLIVAADASESSALSDTMVVVASASSVKTTDSLTGSNYVEVTQASVTVNQFAGGYLRAIDGAGEGYAYRIRSNTVTGDPATGTVRYKLYDELQKALTASSTVAITGDAYANLEAATTTTDENIVGVTVANFDVSEAAYGWVQTRGVGTVLNDGTGGLSTIGDMVTLSDSVAGAYQVADAWTEPVIGVALDAVATGAHGGVMLRIE